MCSSFNAAVNDNNYKVPCCTTSSKAVCTHFLLSSNVRENNSSWCLVSTFLTSYIMWVGVMTISLPTHLSHTISLLSTNSHVYHVFSSILKSCSLVSYQYIKYNVVITATMHSVHWYTAHPNAVRLPSLIFCCHDAHHHLLQLSWYCFITSFLRSLFSSWICVV